MFFNKLKLSHKLYIGFGIIIFLMVFILIYTYINFTNQKEAVDLNLKSNDIMEEADSIMISLLNMETGARGYALAGSDEFLAPFNEGEIDFTKHYNTLLTLTSEDSLQQEKLEDLDERYNVWLKWEKTVILSNREKVNQGLLSIEDIVASVQSKFGKNEMDAIRENLNDIISRERNILYQRNDELDKTQKKTTYVMLFGGTLTAILSVIISVFTAMTVSKPVKLLIAATESITDQNYTVQVRMFGDKELNVLIQRFNEMQNAIQKREAELKVKNEALKSQMAEVSEANKLKSQFLANMSHELRTPLNSIIGFTNRVIKKGGDCLPPVQQENLIIVREEANHLLELINSLLDYSKIEAGKMEIHTEAFNLLKVMEEVYKMTITLAEGQDLQYKQVTYTEDFIPMKSDRMKIKQILINLLSNAFKYSDKGTVVFSVEKKEMLYYISVKDEGVGISEEDLKHIFDEFRQVDGSYTRKVGGTGLGLSITKKFVEMLGGEIIVNSVPGEGSCFTVILPEDIDVPHTEDYGKLENTVRGNRRKIVCVDDDINVQRLYKQYLQEYDFDIISLDGKEDVIEQIKQIMPDAVLLDIMLPNKDGWEILTYLKNDNKTKNIPIIMASVLSEKKLAYRMKADEYLIKPVTQEELFETIMRTISKKSGIDVLIGDDDENFLNLIAQFLSEESIPYRLARDGEEVMQELSIKKPNLLILDIMMPKKDGFNVIEEIRHREDIKDTPIIVVTAKDLTIKEKEELHDRANLIIQKSAVMMDTAMETLVKRIKEKFQDA